MKTQYHETYDIKTTLFYSNNKLKLVPMCYPLSRTFFTDANISAMRA
jgi:hypothetical protein